MLIYDDIKSCQSKKYIQDILITNEMAVLTYDLLTLQNLQNTFICRKI